MSPISLRRLSVAVVVDDITTVGEKLPDLRIVNIIKLNVWCWVGDIEPGAEIFRWVSAGYAPQAKIPKLVQKQGI